MPVFIVPAVEIKLPRLPSYIKDTTHFLQKLDSLPELSNGCLLVTLDVSSLYTNIPHKKEIRACRRALESRTNTRLETESICDLIRRILAMNSFEFENNHYLQLHGTAMGTKMAPAYANPFMGDLEQIILAQSPLKPLQWWRYIDDFFMIWPHGKKRSMNSSTFLILLVKPSSSPTKFYLHLKSTDTHQYLLSSSCHPNHIKKSIPYSLALRIGRICSTNDNFKQRTDELWNFSVNAATKETTSKPKSTKLSMSHVKHSLPPTQEIQQPCSICHYLQLSLPNFNNIIKKYYPILTASNCCQNAFEDPPLLAYSRPRNLRDTLVRAKVETPKTSPSTPPKITRCNDGRCKTCKFIAHNTTSCTSHNTGQTRTIHHNLIYMIDCKRKTDTCNSCFTVHWANWMHPKRTFRRT